MMKNCKVLWGVLALLALGTLPRNVAAGGVPPAQPLGGQATAAHITKAQTVLRNQARGSLFFIQMGCTLKGVNTDYLKRHPDGGFTVGVRYGWSGLDNGNDYTDIYYKFDANGRLMSSQVGATSAIIFTPFSVANGAIQALRDAIRNELQNAPQAIRAIAEQYLNPANSRGIHEVILKHQLSR